MTTDHQHDVAPEQLPEGMLVETAGGGAGAGGPPSRELQELEQLPSRELQELEQLRRQVYETANALAGESTSTYVCTQAAVDHGGFSATLVPWDASQQGPGLESEITITVRSRRPAFTEGFRYVLSAARLMLLLAVSLAGTAAVQAGAWQPRERQHGAPMASVSGSACRCGCKPLRRLLGRSGNLVRNTLRCAVGARSFPPPKEGQPVAGPSIRECR